MPGPSESSGRGCSVIQREGAGSPATPTAWELLVKEFTPSQACTCPAGRCNGSATQLSRFSRISWLHQQVDPHKSGLAVLQPVPRVAASYGLADPFEPVAALKASAKLLADLVSQFGNLGLAAAAYNASESRIGSSDGAHCPRRHATTCTVSLVGRLSIGRVTD